MLETKHDTNQLNFKIVESYFSNLNNFEPLEVVDRVNAGPASYTVD